MEDPSEFAFTCHQQRDLALHYSEGSAPASVVTTGQLGKSNNRRRTQKWIKLDVVERPAPTASKC
jgi:hypothetical protein